MSGGVLFLFFFFFFLILICVLNMIILYNINEGRSRCLFEHASKGKTENTTLTLSSAVWSRLVSNQKKKKRRRKSKKRSEKSHHNMYVLNNTCILYKTNMLKNNTQGFGKYIFPEVEWVNEKWKLSGEKLSTECRHSENVF